MSMFVYIRRNLGLAIEGISQNKLRALLTALGIIFGVFAVVSMLAIGNGAKKSILDQLKIIGTNNIVINSIPPEQNGEDSGGNIKEEKKSYTPGLTLKDVEAIKSIVPGIETLSIEPLSIESVSIESGSMESDSIQSGSIESVSIGSGSIEPLSIEPLSIELLTIETLSRERIFIESGSIESVSIESGL